MHCNIGGIQIFGLTMMITDNDNKNDNDDNNNSDYYNNNSDNYKENSDDKNNKNQFCAILAPRIPTFRNSDPHPDNKGRGRSCTTPSI